MKLIIGNSECWIKDGIILPSNFNSMEDNEKRNHIYCNGLCHREDGPAVIYSNGDEYWFLNGLRHREEGPAVIYSNGSKEWYLNGLSHRIDGPAAIFSDGIKSWYLNDVRVDEEMYKKIEESSMEELLMYMILPKYKNYLSLIEYRLNIL